MSPIYVISDVYSFVSATLLVELYMQMKTNYSEQLKEKKKSQYQTVYNHISQSSCK